MIATTREDEPSEVECGFIDLLAATLDSAFDGRRGADIANVLEALGNGYLAIFDQRFPRLARESKQISDKQLALRKKARRGVTLSKEEQDFANGVAVQETSRIPATRRRIAASPPLAKSREEIGREKVHSEFSERQELQAYLLDAYRHRGILEQRGYGHLVQPFCAVRGHTRHSPVPLAEARTLAAQVKQALSFIR